MTTGGHGGPAPGGPPGPWRPAGTPAAAAPAEPQPDPDNAGPAAGIVGYGKLELFAHGGSALIYRGVQQRVGRAVAFQVLTIDQQTHSLHNLRERDLAR